MSQNYYKLYIDSTLDLAETLVIKSEESAIAINDYLKLLHGSDSVNMYDQSSWKYYKNICGLYHFTDEPIYITSLDTLEKITFTKDNLKIHRATAKAYQYGLRYYRELVSIYPDKEQLILGILYPADMNTAIEAEDGIILSYKTDLIESNEISLIEKLNRWINVYKIRWHNPQFGVTDNLYSAAHLGIMYLNLVPVILNLRLAACKTNEAHSYHIRQYLASHGMLDLYLDQMTKKQALFFYRNITYIERNNGKREIFDWLVNALMTERGLPIAEFTMKHNEGVMPDALYPEITFKKKLINSGVNNEERISYTLDDLFDKEEPLVLGNKSFIEENQVNIKNKFENSLSSVVATKVLESSVIDYTDATPYTFQDIVLNHWLFLSSNNLYKTFISFKNPRTGERHSLQCGDAFIYMMYIYTKALGVNIVNIPSFLATRVQRIPTPTLEELIKVADINYIDKSIVEELISLQPIIDNSISVDAFYEQAREIYNVNQQQLRFVSNQEHQYKRAMLSNVISQFYSDNIIHFENEGMNYIDWLSSKYLPIVDFNINESLDLFKDIFENATGSNLNTTLSIGNVQKAMLGILSKLSSYSIQFISELNVSNIKVLNWAAIRAGEIKSLSKSSRDVIELEILVEKATTKTKNETQVNTTYTTIYFDDKVQKRNKYTLDYKLETKIAELGFGSKDLKLLSKSLFLGASVLNENKDNYLKSAFIGYDNYLNLSSDDKNDIKDIYNTYEDYAVLKTNISNIILYNEINKINYFFINKSEINGLDYAKLNNSADIFRDAIFNDAMKTHYISNGSINNTGFSILDREKKIDVFGLFTYPDYDMSDIF